MFKIRKAFIIRFFALFTLILIVNMKAWAGSFEISAGEKLEYEVSYMGVALGKIVVNTIGSETLDGKKIYKLKVLIDTYKGIPFLSLHSVFESWMDQSLTYSHKFLSTTKHDGYTQYEDIVFDYVTGQIKHKRLSDKKIIFEHIFQHNEKWSDGSSLIFLPRKYLQMKRTLKIPTFVDSKSYTTIKFYGTDESVDIDAVDYPVKAMKITGKAEFKGIYGVTGDFKGWFSSDDARVPLLAEMNVMIGKVKIELIKWKRKNWTPPKV